MPRPSEGYRNKAGEQVPGVHDIVNAYVPKPALVHWAYNQGKKGVPLYEKGTLDIGTAVHEMAELDLRGADPRAIDAKVHELLKEPEHVAKAWLSFNAFTRWRETMNVQSIAHEVSLVSETHQLGGTPDCIAYVDGEVSLLDFKTCTRPPREPYQEQLLVMSAHAALWTEHYPQRPVKSCHIVYLPKDGSVPVCHGYADLDRQWQEYKILLHAYRVKKGLTVPATVDSRDAEIIRLKAEIEKLTAKASRKPKVKAKAPLAIEHAEPFVMPPPKAAPLSMAEILRSYGHLKGW